MSVFNEMPDDLLRQLIDVRQAFQSARDVEQRWEHSFTGGMRWLTRNGVDYLHRKKGIVEKSLGARSPETERQYEAFVTGRDALEETRKQLKSRLAQMRRVNRALGLGRVPTLAARILRRLDDERLLGEHVLLVGTNALFAYEAAAGVRFDNELLATGDADLLWDARKQVTLVLPSARKKGVLGVLKSVDSSFQQRAQDDFRAFNKEGYLVDLIRPEDKADYTPRRRKQLGDNNDDLQDSPILGLTWLISSPKFEAIAIGEDGEPVRIVSPDPRAFALHKLWISSAPNRDPLKRSRDRKQAFAVAELAESYLNLSFDPETLRALPKDLYEAFVTER